jgi:hypothetical protein
LGTQNPHDRQFDTHNPGNARRSRAIVEYRSLTRVFGDQLAARLGDLIGYLDEP